MFVPGIFRVSHIEEFFPIRHMSQVYSEGLQVLSEHSGDLLFECMEIGKKLLPESEVRHFEEQHLEGHERRHQLIENAIMLGLTCCSKTGMTSEAIVPFGQFLPSPSSTLSIFFAVLDPIPRTLASVISSTLQIVRIVPSS